jgi:hypothetical protein
MFIDQTTNSIVGKCGYSRDANGSQEVLQKGYFCF